MKKTGAKKAFTLIELLIVVVVIAVLSGVGIASMNSGRQRSRDTRRIADTRQIASALEMFYDANKRYPRHLYSTEDPNKDINGQNNPGEDSCPLGTTCSDPSETHCVHDTLTSQWSTLIAALASYIPSGLPTSDGKTEKRYCNGLWSGLGRRGEQHYQLYTTLETANGNLSGQSTIWNPNKFTAEVKAANKHFVIQK